MGLVQVGLDRQCWLFPLPLQSSHLSGSEQITEGGSVGGFTVTW